MGFLLFCYVPPAGHRLCRSAWSLNLPKWPVGCHPVLLGGGAAIRFLWVAAMRFSWVAVGCHTVLLGGCAIKIKNGYGSCGV